MIRSFRKWRQTNVRNVPQPALAVPRATLSLSNTKAQEDIGPEGPVLMRDRRAGPAQIKLSACIAG